MARTALMRSGIAVAKNGQAVGVTDGAPSDCCCGTCPFYWRASLCNSQQCGTFTGSPDKYVCSTAHCPGSSTPINSSTTLRYGIFCYAVHTDVQYYPQGVTPPPGGQNIPVGGDVVVGDPPACSPTCAECPSLDGFYHLLPCGCSSTRAENYYVACSTYWAAANSGIRCPVYSPAAGGCYFVDRAVAYPVLPVGGIEIGGVAVNGCCACCCTTQTITPYVRTWSNGVMTEVLGSPEPCCCNPDLSGISATVVKRQFQCCFPNPPTSACKVIEWSFAGGWSAAMIAAGTPLFGTVTTWLCDGTFVNTVPMEEHALACAPAALAGVAGTPGPPDANSIIEGVERFSCGRYEFHVTLASTDLGPGGFFQTYDLEVTQTRSDSTCTSPCEDGSGSSFGRHNPPGGALRPPVDTLLRTSRLGRFL